MSQYTATVKGGFWPANGVATLQNIAGRGTSRRRIARELARPSLAALREVLITLTGAAAGSAAVATHTRIAAAEELGGQRTIETVTDVNRNTDAADITTLTDDLLSYGSYDPTPVANLDGNPLGTR